MASNSVPTRIALGQSRREAQGRSVLNYLRTRGNAAARTIAEEIPRTPSRVARDNFVDFLIGQGVSHNDASAFASYVDTAGGFRGGWNFNNFERWAIQYLGRDMVNTVLGSPQGSQMVAMGALDKKENAFVQLLVAGRLRSEQIMRRVGARAEDARNTPGNVLTSIRDMQRGNMSPAMRDLLRPSEFNLRDPTDTIVEGVLRPETEISLPFAMDPQGGAMPFDPEQGPIIDDFADQDAALPPGPSAEDIAFARQNEQPITEMAGEPITADLAMESIVGEKRAREIEEEIDDAAKRARPADEAMGGAAESKEADQFDDVVDVGDFFGGYYSGDEFVSTSSNAFDDVVGVGDLFNRTNDPFDEFGN